MRRRITTSLASTAALAAVGSVAGIALGAWLGEGRSLAASPQGSQLDSDGDGIADQSELVNFTNPDQADTDGDGYSDLEELARGTDPRLPEALPPAEELAVGLAAIGDGTWVRADVAIYLPDGVFQGLDFEFGAFAPLPAADGATGLQVPFPTPITLGNGSLAAIPGSAGDSLLIHFDVALPQAVFESFGWLPLYATVGPLEIGPTAAAAQTIAYESGVLMSVETLQPSELEGLVAFSSAPQIGGVVIRPIEPEENIPTSLTANEVCSQTASPIGGGGGLVELQIDSSTCIDADFLFCSVSCAGQVGTSRTIVDPIALIGG